MTGSKARILIDCPVEEAFDFVADKRNERLYNLWMGRVEKTTAGPDRPRNAQLRACWRRNADALGVGERGEAS